MKTFYKIFFCHKGRLNRKKYILWLSVLIVIFSPLLIGNRLNWSLLDSLNPFEKLLCNFFIWFFTCCFWFCNFNLVAKRFHDINISGKYWFGTFIPVYNLYLGLKLLFKKGTQGTNRFGEDPLAPLNPYKDFNYLSMLSKKNAA